MSKNTKKNDGLTFDLVMDLLTRKARREAGFWTFTLKRYKHKKTDRSELGHFYRDKPAPTGTRFRCKDDNSILETVEELEKKFTATVLGGCYVGDYAWKWIQFRLLTEYSQPPARGSYRASANGVEPKWYWRAIKLLPDSDQTSKSEPIIVKSKTTSPISLVFVDEDYVYFEVTVNDVFGDERKRYFWDVSNAVICAMHFGQSSFAGPTNTHPKKNLSNRSLKQLYEAYQERADAQNVGAVAAVGAAAAAVGGGALVPPSRIATMTVVDDPWAVAQQLAQQLAKALANNVGSTAVGRFKAEEAQLKEQLKPPRTRVCLVLVGVEGSGKSWIVNRAVSGVAEMLCISDTQVNNTRWPVRIEQSDAPHPRVLLCRSTATSVVEEFALDATHLTSLTTDEKRCLVASWRGINAVDWETHWPKWNSRDCLRSADDVRQCMVYVNTHEATMQEPFECITLCVPFSGVNRDVVLLDTPGLTRSDVVRKRSRRALSTYSQLWRNAAADTLRCDHDVIVVVVQVVPVLRGFTDAELDSLLRLGVPSNSVRICPSNYLIGLPEYAFVQNHFKESAAKCNESERRQHMKNTLALEIPDRFNARIVGGPRDYDADDASLANASSNVGGNERSAVSDGNAALSVPSVPLECDPPRALSAAQHLARFVMPATVSEDASRTDVANVLNEIAAAARNRLRGVQTYEVARLVWSVATRLNLSVPAESNTLSVTVEDNRNRLIQTFERLLRNALGVRDSTTYDDRDANNNNNNDDDDNNNDRGDDDDEESIVNQLTDGGVELACTSVLRDTVSDLLQQFTLSPAAAMELLRNIDEALRPLLARDSSDNFGEIKRLLNDAAAEVYEDAHWSPEVKELYDSLMEIVLTELQKQSVSVTWPSLAQWVRETPAAVATLVGQAEFLHMFDRWLADVRPAILREYEQYVKSCVALVSVFAAHVSSAAAAPSRAVVHSELSSQASDLMSQLLKHCVQANVVELRDDEALLPPRCANKFELSDELVPPNADSDSPIFVVGTSIVVKPVDVIGNDDDDDDDDDDDNREHTFVLDEEVFPSGKKPNRFVVAGNAGDAADVGTTTTTRRSGQRKLNVTWHGDADDLTTLQQNRLVTNGVGSGPFALFIIVHSDYCRSKTLQPFDDILQRFNDTKTRVNIFFVVPSADVGREFRKALRAFRKRLNARSDEEDDRLTQLRFSIVELPTRYDVENVFCRFDAALALASALALQRVGLMLWRAQAAAVREFRHMLFKDDVAYARLLVRLETVLDDVVSREKSIANDRNLTLLQHIQNRAWKFIDGHDQLIQEVMQSNALLQLFEQRKAELLAAFVETEQRMTVPQSYAELLRRCWLPDVEIVVPRQAPTQVGHVELLFREPRRQLAQFFRESLQRYCAVGVTTYDQQKHNLSSSYATHRVVDLKQAYRGAYYVDVPALRAGGGSFWRKPSGKTEAQSLGVRWSHCFPRRFLVELTGYYIRPKNDRQLLTVKPARVEKARDRVETSAIVVTPKRRKQQRRSNDDDNDDDDFE